MEFAERFPIWGELTPAQQEQLARAAVARSFPQGTLLHQGDNDCTGLLLVDQGRLRAYILSPEGREITLYRLRPPELCLFSAPCVLHSLQVPVQIQAERDTRLWVIPPEPYRALMEACAPVANYTNQVMAARLSQVMWLLEQTLWQGLDRRLARFLLEEAALEGSPTLRVTHEAIGRHLGVAREAVTRMLRYFQEEGLVALSRGTVTLTGREKLEKFAQA